MMVLLVMGNDRGTVEHRGRALHPLGGAGAGHDRWGPAGDRDGTQGGRGEGDAGPSRPGGGVGRYQVQEAGQ